MDRQMISLMFFLCAISVFAETPQSETAITPPIRRSAVIPLLGPQQAPSSHSTEGPAGRPNLELVPLSSGSVNALSPSMNKGVVPVRKRTAPDAEVTREASGPLPDGGALKSNEVRQ